MISVKSLKQLFIFTVVSLVGMLVSHYIPRPYFWYWAAVSLIIGHWVNRKNYK